MLRKNRLHFETLLRERRRFLEEDNVARGAYLIKTRVVPCVTAAHVKVISCKVGDEYISIYRRNKHEVRNRYSWRRNIWSILALISLRSRNREIAITVCFPLPWFSFLSTLIPCTEESNIRIFEWLLIRYDTTNASLTSYS